MYKLNIKYECEGKVHKTHGLKTKDFEIEISSGEGRFNAILKPKHKIKFCEFRLVSDFRFTPEQRIFVNGYRSWTESREYAPSEKMDLLNIVNDFFLKSPFNKNTGFGAAGDLFFCKHPKRAGEFYGYSYGYVRNQNEIDLIASLDESTGYTIIRFNSNNNTFSVEKDLEGVIFDSESTIIDFVRLKGAYDDVFDRWFSLMNISCRQKEKMNGYTTWYNYYGNVDESIVKRDLEAISELPQKVDIFQIDDGYQKAIGDWLNTNEKKFPSSMKYTADNIHGKNMLAGLWLAPFAATKDSFIYKEHKDWLVRNKSGKPCVAGANWGGFYVVDFLHPQARKYLQKVFDTVLNEWGYDMVKLDFLYAACIVPRQNKSRGQLMCEAMDFIRECVGDKLILGCGVPLMPCFGKVDFCRIGPDVSLDWRFNPFGVREDVSTPNTVACTVFRRGLNGRAFMNDPDVFLIRDNNIKMDYNKRKLLATVNSLFGSLLFVSDNVSEYDEEKLAFFTEITSKNQAKILKAEIENGDIIKTTYEKDGKNYTLSFNYKNGTLL